MPRCKSCKEPIVFVKTKAGASMPCDATEVLPELVSEYERYVITTSPRSAEAEVIEGKPLREMLRDWHGCGLKIYIPHWATCPNAAAHIKKDKR